MAHHTCMNCNVSLTGDEISLYKKLVYRGAEHFLCLNCMASNLGTSRKKLEELIYYYHETGICSLFAKW